MNQILNVNRSDFLELSQEILGQGARLRFQAHGESMRPFIEHGDVIVIEPIDGARARIGDVIFYHQEDGRIIVHRLIKIDRRDGETVLSTKGDSLDYFDPPLRSDQVLGRVNSVERNGKSWRLDSKLTRIAIRLLSKRWPIRSLPNYILRIGWRLYQVFTTHKVSKVSVVNKEPIRDKKKC